VSDVELRVEDDPARACAELLAEGRGNVVLTGGRTPERAYELAAELRPDWSDAELWWGDERCVPPDHELSNYGLAKRALLDRLETPPRAIHRIRGEDGAERAAAAYDRELRGVALDLVLLGVGPDGHTASLFPHAPTLHERERLAVPAEPLLAPLVERVTMTIPPLESAPLVVFLVAGEEKAQAVARAFGGESDETIPASLVRSRNGRTVAILDQEAARLLGR
jgi:6-phosphogluconolactonase